MILKKRGLFISILVISLITITILFSFHKDFCRNSKKSNILLITIDTLRADHLSCYGYKRKTSPNIDRLAKEGILFTQAFSQASWTLPSLSALITSSFPKFHLIDGFKDFKAYLNPSRKTLAQILKNNGYITGIISDWQVLRKIVGLREQFDEFYITENDRPEKVTRLALKWLNKKNGFFLWIHYFGAHGPYNSDFLHEKKYINDEFYKYDRRIPIADNDLPVTDKIPKCIAMNNITNIDHYTALYDGKINYIDEQIKTILKGLKEKKIDKHTLIIITSDHGESLGEHGFYFSHGTSLYDELLKVPLIIKFPNPSAFNEIINEPVQLIDIFPTILEFLKIEYNEKIDGSSLVPVISGKSKLHSGFIFSDIQWQKCIRQNKFKLIYIDFRKFEYLIKKKFPDYDFNLFKKENFSLHKKGSYELYDLANDPQESVNLFKTKGEISKFFKKEIDKYSAEHIDFAIKPSITMTADEKEVLRSLGYVQ